MYYELTDRFAVSADLQTCWRFFSDAANLPKITPPWLGFTVDMPEPLPEIRQDATLDYTIRWMGLPIHWRTRIIDFTPPRQFIDLQIRGPYALWHHQHTFEPREGGGVNSFDRVIYQLPVPIVRRVVHAMTVRRQLLEIFRYRRKVIGENLGWIGALQDDVRISRLT